jgi:uncharacterized protein YndB with AHSA1/START domain
MASFTLVRRIEAPPEVVFDVITDHAGYDRITPLRRSELEREGDPAPNGVGAIRVLHSVGPPLREEVVAYERPTRFSYTLISGLPVRKHVGTVELSERDGATEIVYVVRAEPTVPLAGGAVIAAIRVGVKRLIDGVAAESERRAAAPA